MERHIRATARRVLGDSADSILLPPPPATLASGRIHLGSVKYLHISHPFGLSPSDLLQGIGIYGRSGAGKTNIVFGLLRQLDQHGIPFLFLDTKRTVRHFLPSLNRATNLFTPGRALSPVSFNPLIPPTGVELRAHAAQLVDALATAYTLGDGAKSLLQKLVLDGYGVVHPWPTFKTILHAARNLEAKGRAVGWKASMLRALESLTFAGGFEAVSTDQSRLVDQLLGQNTIFELDGLDENAQQFLVSSIVNWLFHYRLQAPDREVVRLMIIVEEAHHFLYRQENRAKESAMNRLLRQCREVGIGVVVVDQHPHLISSAALGNTFTSICLNLKEPTDISRAAAMMLLREDQKRYLNSIPVGDGIVKLQGRWQKPFLVNFPEQQIAKGRITDEVLAKHLRGGRVRAFSTSRTRARGGSAETIEPELSGASVEETEFLVDCDQHPLDPVRNRYRRLGLSADRGTRLKESLISRRLLTSARIPVGRTKRLVLRPTDSARQMTRGRENSVSESIEHAFWKEFYFQKYRARGYKVTKEAPRSGGRVDVLAERDGERIGIEIETGKSDILSNVVNCLKSDLTQVVIVATDERSLRSISSQLRNKNLDKVNRVTLHIRDQPIESP